jgi:hypothetical protein
MALIVRGMVWFGLYLFLVLLPLATAALSGPERVSPGLIGEIGVGVGFVGLALMCLEFALISRIKAAAQAFREHTLQALRGETWIVDGNHWEVRDIVWGRADLLVWLNYSPLSSWATDDAAAPTGRLQERA